MKLTIEQLEFLGFKPFHKDKQEWGKPIGNQEAYFYYNFKDFDLKTRQSNELFELRASGGGDIATVYGPILSLKKFHELVKVLNS